MIIKSFEYIYKEKGERNVRKEKKRERKKSFLFLINLSFLFCNFGILVFILFVVVFTASLSLVCCFLLLTSWLVAYDFVFWIVIYDISMDFNSRCCYSYIVVIFGWNIKFKSIWFFLFVSIYFIYCLFCYKIKILHISVII